MSLQFKHFENQSDLDRQRELFKLSFPEVEDSSIASEKHYRWKFHSFPSTQTSYEFVAVEDDIMAGYYAAIPYRYIVNGKELTAGMVCDVMTHPKMRGRGVFKKLGQYSTDELKELGVNFTTGYPIRPEVIPGHLRVGWKIAVELPVYLCPLKSDSILKAKRLAFLAPIFNLAINALQAFFGVFAPKASDYSVEVFEPSALESKQDLYSNFLEKWYRTQKYHLVKDLDFLKWRLGAPNHEYQIHSLTYQGQIVAIAITCVTDLKGIPSLAILDLMCLPEHNIGLPKLFRAMKEFALANSAEGLATMCSKYWAARYKLSMNGFLKTPAIFKYITKPLNLDIPEEEFMQEQNWHLMWIDCDDL